MTFDSIINRAEFFSDHYLDARLATDLEDLRKAWEAAEGNGVPTSRSSLKAAQADFFKARAAVAEASDMGYVDAVRELNNLVLTALGFTPDRTEVALARNTGTDDLVVSLAAQVKTATGPLLVAIDAGWAEEADELFDTDRREEGEPPGLLLSPLHRDGGKAEITSVADAPGELFSVDDPPRFVLVCAGTTILLAERAKWAEGRFLAVELDAALERSDTKAKGELETIAALFGADALIPGHLVGEEGSSSSFFDDVEDKSTRHAVGVSKELREGMHRSVEVLANEVIEQRLARRLGVYEGENRVDPNDLTKQCLRYLYRLIVLFYAESRPELGVLPTNDDAYMAGYSLDRLRELVLTQLDDEHARNGTHLDESIRLLFDLVNHGYHAEAAEQMLVFATDEPDVSRSAEDYLQFPGLDATIFDPGSTPLFDSVSLRNEALQRVLALLMLNRESKKKGDQRGFISYAQLGINQLGAVYEGLMAYTGFFAKEELFEVAKNGDPKDGTWMVPVTHADEYPEEVFVQATDPLSGKTDRVRHTRGSFVYRLAGRDRQRSASYYTPEVLTSCVVRHALAELLGTDDYARVPGGSAGVTDARQILDLTVCEPALGSGAFLNEAINQLSAEYLKRRQAELGETLDAESYQRELQKVKAHFALHQSYGVDLNATAVELAEVSLWLNCMHPGLKAPWFGLRLRRGNSLIGARRATWRASRLKDKVWAKNKSSDAVPPTGRPLAEPLELDEIHHFLLPGHGWGAVAVRKEGKELAPAEAKALGEWRKVILKAPSAMDAERLCALAAGVERLWGEATDLLDRLAKRMRRPLDVYGAEDHGNAPADDRRTAEAILNNPDSALGRLRLVMDAWVGLWFWTLDGEVTPPSWGEWLSTLERIVGPEFAEPMGQLDFFADLAAVVAAEERRAAGREPVAELLESVAWVARAQELARREGAWHWELEFASLFRSGGFDLQVGNPPWLKLVWDPIDVLSEWDPRLSVLENPPDAAAAAQAHAPALVSELARSAALMDSLGSSHKYRLVSSTQRNLYRAFLEVCWANSSAGVVGLIHPHAHLTDPRAGDIRREAYLRTRRLFHFTNEARLFSEIHNQKDFALNIYSSPGRPRFILSCSLHTPSTLEESILHNGTGTAPAPRLPNGKWDERGHRDRIMWVDGEVLGAWASLSSDVEVADAPPLQLPFSAGALDVVVSLARRTERLSQVGLDDSNGIVETDATRAGILLKQTAIVSSLDQVVFKGPVFDVASPFQSTPNPGCKSNRDYSVVPYRGRSSSWIPLSNFGLGRNRADVGASQACDISDRYRIVWRKMVDEHAERTLKPCIIPPGPLHVHTCISVCTHREEDLLWVGGMLSSIVCDFMVKTAGKADILAGTVSDLPPIDRAVRMPVAFRAARLNCVSPEYERLWAMALHQAPLGDSWAIPPLEWSVLGLTEPVWSERTPLLSEAERRAAMIEIDALTAIGYGLSLDELLSIFRTTFGVLQKYESRLAFDALGSRVAGDHHSFGALQEGKADWERVQQWFDEPRALAPPTDWQYFPPFTRADREVEMTRAYNEFQRRLDAGEYG